MGAGSAFSSACNFSTSLDGEIAEIIANVVLNIFTNYFNIAADTEIDFPLAPALAA